MTIIQTTLLVYVLHFIADFNLQIGANLHNMKCKEWWDRMFEREGILDSRKYGDDWRVALWIHSYVWGVITFSPLIWQAGESVLMMVMLLVNMIVHAIVDGLKCNKRAISLKTDQNIHAVQIAITLLLYWLLIHK